MIQVTVLQDEEMFGTMWGGELRFWEVIEGVPTSVKPEEIDPGDYRMRLYTEEPKPTYLRVVFEAESDRSNYQHFWVGTQEEGAEPAGMITTHPDTALWLSNTFGDPKYRSDQKHG